MVFIGSVGSAIIAALKWGILTMALLLELLEMILTGVRQVKLLTA